ncbi:MAG TPA: MBL fold metallo-hydrolase [Pseudomonadales bacterium]|nr:MBL fold metallo-hydrolase [Pseudomonadales bacterium]
MFPHDTRGAVVRFWAWYWLWFFALLPWMLLRQVFVSAHQAVGALATWNRRVDLFGGELRLVFMNDLSSLALTAVFGERFTAIHYRDVLIDPGPLFGRRRLERYLETDGRAIRAIVATHAHEEHVGNAALASRRTGAPVYGTPVTLAAIREPERLSLPRRAFIGQPEPETEADLRPLGDAVDTPAARLEVIASAGHCDGHASLFDAGTGVLFAGDSFLHTVFTAPNRDVSGEEWIATLERYRKLDVRTLIGTHGSICTKDPGVPRLPFVTVRADPNAMIRDKLDFLCWARDVVAEGERRGLPYSVIEACLFPWQRWWSWHNWFTDESGRLFSAGEFSRTYFVRSLSRTPQRVPARFPPFARLAAWASGRLRRVSARFRPRGT